MSPNSFHIKYTKELSRLIHDKINVFIKTFGTSQSDHNPDLPDPSLYPKAGAYKPRCLKNRTCSPVFFHGFHAPESVDLVNE